MNTDINEPNVSDSDSPEEPEESLIQSRKRTRQSFDSSESSDEEMPKNAREPNAKKRYFGEPSAPSESSINGINDDGNMKSPQ